MSDSEGVRSDPRPRFDAMDALDVRTIAEAANLPPAQVRVIIRLAEQRIREKLAARELVVPSPQPAKEQT